MNIERQLVPQCPPVLHLRTEEPPARANGTFPVKNDYQLILGIALRVG